MIWTNTFNDLNKYLLILIFAWHLGRIVQRAENDWRGALAELEIITGILSLRQIHFLIWTNPFGKFDKYIQQFGQILAHSCTCMAHHRLRMIEEVLRVNRRRSLGSSEYPQKILQTQDLMEQLWKIWSLKETF